MAGGPGRSRSACPPGATLPHQAPGLGARPAALKALRGRPILQTEDGATAFGPPSDVA